MSVEASERCVIRRIAEVFAAAFVADSVSTWPITLCLVSIAVVEYQIVDSITVILHVMKLNGYLLA